MTPILADTSPEAIQLASWLSVLFYLGGFCCTVLGGLWALKEIRKPASAALPQPLEVQESHAFATVPELNALASKMDEELGRERGARKKIHEEIATIQSTVSSIRTENEKQSNDLTEVKQDVKRANERIDGVPERTIRLLRETKGLI